MPFVESVGAEKSWAPVVVAAMILTSVTIAFLLLADRSPPVSASPPAATLVDTTPREPGAPSDHPDAPTAEQISASETPPAPQPGVPDGSEDSSPSAREQRVFRTRRALETVDPREFLRQTTMPK